MSRRTPIDHLTSVSFQRLSTSLEHLFLVAFIYSVFIRVFFVLSCSIVALRCHRRAASYFVFIERGRSCLCDHYLARQQFSLPRESVIIIVLCIILVRKLFSLSLSLCRKSHFFIEFYIYISLMAKLSIRL